MSPRHVVVVGGAGAIGSVVAAVLAEQGMRVTVADFADPSTIVDALPGTGHAGLTIDVTDRENVLAALGPAASVGRYDALVFAAGTNYTGPVATTDWDAWDRVMNVNLRGAAYFGQAASLNLEADPRECSIVYFSSTAGLVGEGGASVYASSKFGLIGFMQCHASEIARFGARANAVCPGNIDSPMLRTLAAQVAERNGVTTEETLALFAGSNAFNRLIDIREVAQVVAFLASAASTGMSGQSVVIDGPPN
ncbi:NAD(P)-dependent dehydrogenase (short-subunit alcohol dehydrogenase family) [Microbacteriaceae bacterium SG_E_30_P1]|uniref:NAD(P)-dependent dehydrogenase (Short-subunit alcohol dehydrogenase family) n=1 Tax=Antiquaquibacter oligotrophicus TaxID=2880260 RepID=A0ABT6KMW0_9MICO|nr:SDR family oxidoreductase [Antiquaquibacter oligotrophicus]MDH6181075.1 NAD(P)-dependent dehydrogenase (short-subunit alcohol dehydrogenase family) [Antiquaquibacter oligotrophicus]UDF13227.1 SDR family oxidoreductase [Antiquaquibacter oligotrophicus]